MRTIEQRSSYETSFAIATAVVVGLGVSACGASVASVETLNCGVDPQPMYIGDKDTVSYELLTSTLESAGTLLISKSPDGYDFKLVGGHDVGLLSESDDGKNGSSDIDAMVEISNNGYFAFDMSNFRGSDSAKTTVTVSSSCGN